MLQLVAKQQKPNQNMNRILCLISSENKDVETHKDGSVESGDKTFDVLEV